MAISTNSIIHYTTSIDSLKNILSEGFKVKYCYESVNSKGNGHLHAAFPMVSFCDIPLSQVKEHLDSYGDYGIGLKKEWAKSKHLNPVLYFDQDSEIMSFMRVEFQRLVDKGKANQMDRKDYEIFFRIIAFSKNYEANLKRKGNVINNYRFYNEREWRYVPNAAALGTAKLWVSEKNYKADKDKYNNTLDHIRLTFETTDISYIIVKAEDDIKKVTPIIRNIFSEKCTLQQMEILLTRIMTSDQIRYDI